MRHSITPAWGLRHPVASLSHLMAFAAALFVAALLVKMARRDPAKRFSVAVFGVCMCLLYLASGTYHAVIVPPDQLRVFQLLDHTAIYLLIAGTYTPACVVLLRGRARAGMLALVWGLAVAGIACKWLLPLPPFWLTVGFYVGLGWAGLLVLGSLVQAVGARGMVWVLIGGTCYTAGGVMDVVQWPVLWPGVIGSHELLHVLDVGGTAAHVVFIVRYVIPYRPPLLADAAPADVGPEPVPSPVPLGQ
jgi:hemolysin III